MADQPATTPAVIGAPTPPHPFIDDVGGVFETDAHRRVLGHLPTPLDRAAAESPEDHKEAHPGQLQRVKDNVSISPEALCVRLNEDSGAPDMKTEAVAEILAELASAGHAESSKFGLWCMTEAGHNAIQGGDDV